MTPAKPRILVVDDDDDARLLMRAALRKAGFEVGLAVDGDDALRQFAAQPWDMVMLDVEMPGRSGHEVCTALRAQCGELLPIVMVTGMDDLHSVEAAYVSGATDFIAKPINWPLFGHRVRYLLRGYQALLDLRAAEERHVAVLQAIPDLLFEVDLEGRYRDYRAPNTDLLAAPPQHLLGRTIAEVMPPEAAQTCMAALRQAHACGTSFGHQFELRVPKGASWFELSVARKATPAGEAPRFIVLSRDITERKEAEMRIARLAYFDSLTGLPNRQAFLERVDREIARAGHAGAKFGVLFMDLDGFKNINDTLGHSAGDLVLQWAADRLRQGLRPTDVVSRAVGDGDIELARLGGDEFTALILGVDRPEDALVVAHRVGHLMRRPFLLDGREIMLTTSIGIALFPEDGHDATTLLKHADTAMYHAKGSGRDNTQLYSASLTEQAMRRMELDTSLRLALDRHEFHLVYQPQLDVDTGRIRSVEALLRWQHPVRGMVGPLDFIPLAEENGTILAIGEWVLRTACADAARWQAAGHGVVVAVNLSPVQFKHPGLVQAVQQALADARLPAAALELEITESAVMENTDETIRTLRAFRDSGVRIALDDFGTGYSSLSYLTRMPVSNLKVDRSFVKGLLLGGEHSAIVRAVLAMADSLGMRVTAEGVETIEQARALAAMACDSLQGYYISRPVAADVVPSLLTRRWSLLDGPGARPSPVPANAPADKVE
jgi:diguanylate cyclase (GGDEF)-like protein/PAS domain S-box-containing protein